MVFKTSKTSKYSTYNLIKKGGNFFKFDLFSVGKISFERDYNKLFLLKKEHREKLNQIDAFIHSFDFTSKSCNIFTRPNPYKFIKNNIHETDNDKFNYFLINIKKNICKNETFILVLKNIFINYEINKLSKNRFSNLSNDEIYNMFDILIDYIINLCNYIKFDNLLKKNEDSLIQYLNNPDNVNDTETILLNIDRKTTDDFLHHIKLQFNHYNDKKGGGLSDDDEIFDDLEVVHEYDYISYEDIKEIFKNRRDIDENFLITDYYIQHFTYIIGFTTIFRYSGLFDSTTKTTLKLNNIYHLLQYYPFNDTSEKQNKFINKVFSDTAKILLEISEILLLHCDQKLDEKKESAKKESAKKESAKKESPKKESPKKESPKKQDTTNLRRSSRSKK